MSGSKWWKSSAGWAFVSVYLIVAAFSVHEALTCTGWVCHIAIIPALIPFGIPFHWVIDSVYVNFPTSTGIPGDHLRSWYFIAPTVLVNSLFYYWLGRFAHKLIAALRRYLYKKMGKSS